MCNCHRWVCYDCLDKYKRDDDLSYSEVTVGATLSIPCHVCKQDTNHKNISLISIATAELFLARAVQEFVEMDE